MIALEQPCKAAPRSHLISGGEGNARLVTGAGKVLSGRHVDEVSIIDPRRDLMVGWGGGKTHDWQPERASSYRGGDMVRG